MCLFCLESSLVSVTGEGSLWHSFIISLFSAPLCYPMFCPPLSPCRLIPTPCCVISLQVFFTQMPACILPSPLTTWDLFYPSLNSPTKNKYGLKKTQQLPPENSQHLLKTNWLPSQIFTLLQWIFSPPRLCELKLMLAGLRHLSRVLMFSYCYSLALLIWSLLNQIKSNQCMSEFVILYPTFAWIHMVCVASKIPFR